MDDALARDLNRRRGPAPNGEVTGDLDLCPRCGESLQGVSGEYVAGRVTDAVVYICPKCKRPAYVDYIDLRRASFLP